MKGIRIINRAEKASAEILIYEDIGEGFFTSGVTAQCFLKELRALGEVNHLDIRINSNGGSVFDGVAIYNALRQHPASKTVHVDGIAASIASIIAMAGDEIHMGQGAYMMIHDPSGLAMGTAEQMRETANLLDGIKAQLVDIYTSRTGIEADAIVGEPPDRVSRQAGVLVTPVTMLAATNSKAAAYGKARPFTLRTWKRGTVKATVAIDANGQVAGRWTWR